MDDLGRRGIDQSLKHPLQRRPCQQIILSKSVLNDYSQASVEYDLVREPVRTRPADVVDGKMLGYMESIEPFIETIHGCPRVSPLIPAEPREDARVLVEPRDVSPSSS
jgi:hypothetical protein